LRQNRETNCGVALEEDVAFIGEILEIPEIERLQDAADVKDDIAVVVTQGLDLSASAKVVVDAVAFAGTRIAGIAKDEGLQADGEIGVKFEEGLGEGAFAGARRA